MPTWTIESSKQHTLHHRLTENPGGRFHNTWIFVQYSTLKICCRIRFSMSAANELKNGSCIFQGSVSAGSEVLITGKWTIHYYWPASPKCKSQLAVAHLHENTGCWWTPSLPSDTCMQRHENHHFIIYSLWRNDFIMSIIAQYSLLGHDKLHPMVGSSVYDDSRGALFIHPTNR